MIGANYRRILPSIRTVTDQSLYHCQPDGTPKPVHPGFSLFVNLRSDLLGQLFLGLWAFREQIEHYFVKAIGIFSVCSKSRHSSKDGFDSTTLKGDDVNVE